MIVEVKDKLAQILIKGIEKITRVNSSKFNETDSNKPRKDCEILLTHEGSAWSKTSKGQYLRFLRFSIDIQLKNLKTDSEIQRITDLVIHQLVTSSVFGHDIVIVSDENLGIDEESFWTYRLGITVPLQGNSETLNCEYNENSFSFDSIAVRIVPSYSIGEE